jgi:cobalamin synthase
MPSLLRFLVVVGVLVGLIYGAIYALASFVEPTPREITVTVPRDILTKPR